MMLINPIRLWDRLIKLSSIGKTESRGITRLSFREEERKTTGQVIVWMKEAGLSVHQDGVGNISGRKEGRNSKLPAVLVGSYLDSVYNGDNFSCSQVQLISF